MTDRDAEIARLQAQLCQLDAERSAERLAALPVWKVGDQARVLRRSTQGVQHIGDVGTVVAVTSPPHAAGIVHLSAVRQVVLLDFGPDEDRYQGRDTWSYADADLGPVEGTTQKKKRKKQ